MFFQDAKLSWGGETFCFAVLDEVEGRVSLVKGGDTFGINAVTGEGSQLSWCGFLLVYRHGETVGELVAIVHGEQERVYRASLLVTIGFQLFGEACFGIFTMLVFCVGIPFGYLGVSLGCLCYRRGTAQVVVHGVPEEVEDEQMVFARM